MPRLIGSGLQRENARDLLGVADGAIVGTSLKTGEHIDYRKVTELVEVVQGLSMTMACVVNGGFDR